MKIPTPLTVKFMKTICHSGPKRSGSRTRARSFAPEVGLRSMPAVPSRISLSQPKITSISAASMAGVAPT